MARLASKEKAGFYPTPDSVTQVLKKMLDVEAGARMLDPCCGEGKTLSALTEGANVGTFGVELDHDRVQEARPRLKTVQWADSLVEMKITPLTFGLVYLNPPYDYETTGYDEEKSDRLEAKFLNNYAGKIQVGGWLVLVIPYHVLKHCSKVLSRGFKNLHVCAFPRPEYDVFKQCVVLGQKTWLIQKDTAEVVRDEFDKIAQLTADDFFDQAPQLDPTWNITIPTAKSPLTHFSAARVDPKDAILKVRQSGLLDNLLINLAPKPRNMIRPLAPLENGHLSLLLVAGYMNGEIAGNNQSLVIKGETVKQEMVFTQTRETEKSFKHEYRDKYVPTIKAIDMNTAQMVVIR